MAEKEIGFRIFVSGDGELLDTQKKLREEIKKTNQALQEAEVGSQAYDKLNKSLIQLKGTQKNLTDQQRKQVKQFQDTQKQGTKTVEGLRAKLANMNKEWARTDIGTKKFKELEGQMAETTAELKKHEKSVGDNRRNVGNYGEAVKGLASQFGLLNGNVGQIAQSFKLLTGATRAQAVATGGASAAAKILKVALISTGIGAIVVALGSLITYLTQTKRGMEFVERATATMGAVFSVFTDRASAIGETLFDAFSNPKQAVLDLYETIKTNLINRVEAIPLIFSAVGKAIKEGLSGNFEEAGEAAKEAGQAFIQFNTGLDTEQQAAFVDGLKELGSEIATEAKATNDLVAAQQALRKSENDLKESVAARRLEISTLKLVAEDQLKTDEERLKAADKAIALEKSILADQLAIANEKVRIQDEQMAMSENLQEDEDKLSELRVAALQEQTMVTERLKEISNQRNNLEKSMTAKKKEEIDKRKKADEDAEKSRVKALADRAKAELLEIEERYNKEIIAAKGNKEAIEKIEEEKKKAIIEKTREALDATLQELTGALLTASTETDDLANILMSDEDRAALELRIQQVKTDISGLDVQLQNLGNPDKDGRPKSISEAMGMTEDGVANFNTGLAAVESGLTAISDLVMANSQVKIAQLEAEKDAAIKAAGDDVAAKEDIEKDYNDRIDAEKKKAGKKAQKIAIIQATIEMAKGIMSAINTGMQAGFPAGLILAPLLAAGVVASGAAQIKTIKAQQFATGGMVQGYGNIPTQSNGDNTLATLKSGEVVLNEMQQAALGGAHTFKSIGVPGFASGGRIGAAPAPSIPAQQAALTQNIDKLMGAMESQTEATNERIDRIRVEVSESDISSTQAKVAEVEETVSFG